VRPLTLFLPLALLVTQGFSASFQIDEARFDSNGVLRISFNARTNTYVILQKTESLAVSARPISMRLGGGTTDDFRVSPTATAVFYRLLSVPRSLPMDTDGDGIDDVFELRHPAELDPLNPSDAPLDADGDGLNNVAHYREIRFARGKRRIAAGDHHFLALRTDGTLWAAGENRLGQIGDGTTNNHVLPVLIAPDFRWVAVAASEQRSYAIRNDGTLWAWGQGRLLGFDTSTNRLFPTQIGSDVDWVAIATSPTHTMGLKEDGSLWAWGSNGAGQFGDGSSGRTTPGRVTTEGVWKDVDAGQNFTMALNSENRLFTTGSNESGQLGLGVTNSTVGSFTPVDTNIWLSIAAGDFHGVGLRNDHTLWTWGSRILPGPTSGTISPTNDWAPVQVETNSNWIGIAAGYFHTVACDASGTLWAWGLNQSGEIGDGTQLPRFEPVRISSGNPWISVVANGGNHLGVRDDGSLWNWSSTGGQPLNLAEAPFQPVLSERKFRSIAAGDFHSLAVEEDGTVWGWGGNEVGQLGDGSLESGSPRPISTNALSSEGLVFTNIAGNIVGAAGNQSLLLDVNGKLWFWGERNDGQMGSRVPNPWQLFPDGVFTGLAVGAFHIVALTAQGTTVAFGESSSHAFPVNDTAFLSIGAGSGSSFAVDQNGAVHIWGSFLGANFFGEAVASSNKYVNVIGGVRHALAFRDDGTIWSMGNNTYGQLGIGTNSYPGILKPVMTNMTFKATSACYHNLAIGSDGSLWFWGYDQNRSVTKAPLKISTNTNWKAVAAGYTHSLALKEDGSLWSWGKNGFGQLGASPVFQYSADRDWIPPLDE
jgi:alpha-tubulin suppressor-like RCC1 family protein